jgi:hypothetical protein
VGSDHAAEIDKPDATTAANAIDAAFVDRRGIGLTPTVLTNPRSRTTSGMPFNRSLDRPAHRVL